MELLTAEQMRAIEQAAIDSGEVTGLELMERAGRGVVEAIFEEWPELRATSHRAVVLCGPGNNGGDGFVVARLLKEWGWEVEVFLYGDPDKLPPDARVNCERWEELGQIAPLEKGALAAAIDRDFEKADFQVESQDPYRETNVGQTTIYIDALFGTGLKRRFDDDLLEIGREWLDHCYEFGVAVDMPSGLCSDSGKCIGGHWFYSRRVVTFEAAKVGHYLSDCNYDIKKIYTVPLHLDQGGSDIHLMSDMYLSRNKDGLFDDGLGKSQRQHKYTHGHALILSGGPGKTGAARLAARAALRIGAGLVTVACPQQALWEVSTHVTAIMCQTLDGPPGLREILEDDRLNALCLGPGMGLGADTQALVLEALKHKRATVLDADALTRFQRNPQVLFEALHDKCVLTPHAGEFRRLFPDIADKLDAPAETGPAYSKVNATRDAAARAGCTVLFKGPDTAIAAPDGRCAINSSAYDRAAPWLATAGSGDVLAGFITGLLARSFAPMQAAETAAWLHTECALSFGPGLIAEDLPEELPKVFKTLI
ncbi:MAG: NAD(P)H-hydrate dehydratase [Pseudomonadota bacterium]